jgi:hypothetical protein
VIRPEVQINSVEGDSLGPNGNDRDMRAHFMIEAILVHAEISRCVAQADEARQEF